MEIRRYKQSVNFRLAYIYLYPFIIISGLFGRMYMGDLSLNFIQETSAQLHMSCIFHWLTGWDCPGCGMTRSLIALYLWSPHWSFYFHPLGPAIGVVSFFLWLSCLNQYVQKYFIQIYKFAQKRSFSFLLILIAWGLIRNF